MITITCQHCSTEIDPAQDPACVVYDPSGATDVICYECRKLAYRRWLKSAREMDHVSERWGRHGWRV